MSQLDVISDHAKERLVDLPKELLELNNLKMLFLEGNLIRELPADFFYTFPRLMWLDLRNNSLDSIPLSIAHHPFLESFLLTNNKITSLPNELGTVPHLKTLQISDNPILYPTKNIINQGTKYLLSYMKSKYEQDFPDITAPSEELINVTDHENIAEIEKISAKETKEELAKKIASTHTAAHELRPTLSVKKLTNPKKEVTAKKPNQPIKIVHKISRHPSKISLKSYYNIKTTNNDKLPDVALKDLWLEKLRILLSDQEKILQQERNLRELASWRSLKKREALTAEPKEAPEFNPPFGTDPKHNKILTREDLSKELDEFMRERSISPKRPGTPTNIKIGNMINDLVRQLKDIEMQNSAMQTPRTEINQAGQQIKTIMEIHKKILQLQESNSP